MGRTDDDTRGALPDVGDGPIVMEGALLERLRRDPSAPALHPSLVNARFVQSRTGRAALERLWDGYLDAILGAGLPALLLSPTWRAGSDRLAAAGLGGARLNEAGVELVREVRDRRGSGGARVLVAGLLGCRGDAYRPGEGLGEEAALAHHWIQAEALARGRPDLLLASTLPAVDEAAGLARAMAATGLPYLVGFVLRGSGRLLDGTPLDEAVRRIDGSATPAPAGYLVTCTHPETLLEALSSDAFGPATRGRLVGIQGNGSRLSPEELDGRAELDTTTPDSFAGSMLSLRRRFGLRLLGGCCGTDDSHIRALCSVLVGA